MLNEEISKEVVGTSVRAINEKLVKPTLNFVMKYIAKPTSGMIVDDLKKAFIAPVKIVKDKLHPEHGEMSVKDLIRKDQGAQVMDIDGLGLRDFRKIANKYGVDFAIVKSKELDQPTYSVFFKARDADAITAVVNEYTAKQLRIEKEGRPSILAKLKKFKELIASIPRKPLVKNKEEVR